MTRNLALAVACLLLVSASGCRPTESNQGSLTLWPVWDSQSEIIMHKEGWTKKDHGNAALVVRWNSSQTFDGKGKKVRFNEQLCVWPLFDCTSEQTNSYKRERGSVVLLRYDNRKDAAQVVKKESNDKTK